MENINSSIRKIRDGPLSQYRTALTETISGSNDKFLNTVKLFEILNEQMKGHKKLRSELKDKMLTRKFQLYDFKERSAKLEKEHEMNVMLDIIRKFEYKDFLNQ